MAYLTSNPIAILLLYVSKTVENTLLLCSVRIRRIVNPAEVYSQLDGDIHLVFVSFF